MDNVPCVSSFCVLFLKFLKLTGLIGVEWYVTSLACSFMPDSVNAQMEYIETVT